MRDVPGRPKLFDVRPGEWVTTLLLSGSILTIVTSYTLVKAVRDAVFLAAFGPTELALLFIALAGLAGLFTAVATRMGSGLSPAGRIVWTHGIVALSMLVSWGAFAVHLPGTAWAFYVWSSFVGLFVIANFWLLGNQLYDARSAKRIFPLLGAGAILGGAVGGQTAELATVIGALGLLPIIAGGFVLSALLAVAAWRRGGAAGSLEPVPADEPRPGLLEGFQIVKKHRYLTLLACLLVLATITTTLVDMQLKTVAKQAFDSDRDQMAAFFGRLTKIFSLASLVIQLFVTGKLLRRFGVVTMLLILPTTLALGATAIAFHLLVAIPLLTVAALAKIGDGALRFSVDKAAMELLYLPIPPRVKAQAKPVIDTVADRAGTALTGVLWLVVTFLSGARGSTLVTTVSVVILALLAVWIIAIFRMRAEYVEAFRVSLPGPVVNPHTLGVDLRNPVEQEAIRRSLGSPDERSVLLGLQAVQATASAPSFPRLRELVEHRSPRVRARAFQVLALAGDRQLVVKAQRAAADADPDVRRASMDYLARTSHEAAEELTTHPDVRVRLPALSYLAEAGPSEAARASGHIAELLAGPLAEDQGLRAEIARAVGALPLDEARRHLRRLLTDRDPQVARAAGASAGRLCDVTPVHDLLETLADPRRRTAAQAALQGYGPAAVEALTAAVDDPGLPPEARDAVPEILASVGTQAAADALVCALPAPDAHRRTRVVRALWRLRHQARIRFADGSFERAVTGEVATYAVHLQALRQESVEHGTDGAGARLLRRTLAERVDDDLERIFRLLGLRYPERDVLAAYYGLRQEQTGLRASALELLDILLDEPLKRDLLALLEGESGMALPTGRRLRGSSDGHSRVDSLRALAIETDPWLRACAVYAAGEGRYHELASVVAAAASDHDVRVREAADLAWALLRADGDGPEPAPGPTTRFPMLTTLEKVLFLHEVPLLAPVPTDALVHLGHVAEEVHWTDGEAIWRHGDAADALYFVIAGEVVLEEEPRGYPNAKVGPASDLGTSALIGAAGRRDRTARAVIPTAALRVGRHEFFEVLSEHPELAFSLLDALGSRLEGDQVQRLDTEPWPADVHPL